MGLRSRNRHTTASSTGMSQQPPPPARIAQVGREGALDDILRVVALCQEARALLEGHSRGLLQSLALQSKVREGGRVRVRGGE